MPKENIVLGVNDFKPPTGLVKVQLFDPDRPWRVKKEVEQENAVMNWWLSAANRVGRSLANDTSLNFQAHFDSNESSSEAAFTKQTGSYWPGVLGARPGKWPGRYGNHMKHVWASDVDVEPDADKPWIPSNGNLDDLGNVVGWSSTDTVYGLDNEFTNRGTIVLGSCVLNMDMNRMVMEWGTTQGNGVWRSVGLGSLNIRSGGSMAVPTPWRYYLNGVNYRDQRWTMNIENVPAAHGGVFECADSMAFAEPTQVFAARNNTIMSRNLQTYSNNFGYTAFPVGSGRTTVAWKSPDLWVARGKSVYRVDPSDGTTVNNTYDLTAQLTDGDIIDITCDGTDLYLLCPDNVHVVNSAGVWQSSWAHGRDCDDPYMPGNIEYDPGLDYLWISTDVDGAWTSGSQTDLWNDWTLTGDSSWEGDTWRVVCFNKTGTQQPYWLKPGWKLATDPYYLRMGLTGMDPQGWVSHFGRSYYNDVTNSGEMWGVAPTAASHVNLGQDFEKTSSDSLRLIYEFHYDHSV